ncbi:MAG: hypothetical protein N3D11_12425, partial [Candidatus Sumerlaeia bacterium]|nr:hypothetical protein [Candidatus Sumerlaeia bacterium]
PRLAELRFGQQERKRQHGSHSPRRTPDGFDLDTKEKAAARLPQSKADADLCMMTRAPPQAFSFYPFQLQQGHSMIEGPYPDFWIPIAISGSLAADSLIT